MIHKNEWIKKELNRTRQILYKRMNGRLREHFEDAVQFVLLQRLEGRIFPSVDQLLVDFYRDNKMGARADAGAKSIDPRKWRSNVEFKEKHKPPYNGDYEKIEAVLDLESNFSDKRRVIGFMILMGFTQEEIAHEFGVTASRIGQIVGRMRIEDAPQR